MPSQEGISIFDKHKLFFMFVIWFRGREARQRSAKPPTAVRIRSEPPVSIYI
jgi:hypothetical protein